MRQWINLITESEDRFLADPFLKAWDESARAMGSDPVVRGRNGDYLWRGLEWHVFLRPYGTWTGKTYENTVEIEHIQVVPQRQGIGRKLLTTLCRLADEYKVPLILVADESNDGDPDWDEQEGEADYDEQEHWLQTWYLSLGFDYTGDRADCGPYMEREPR